MTVPVSNAWDDGNCQIEPIKSIDDAMDPEAGSIIAVAFGSHQGYNSHMGILSNLEAYLELDGFIDMREDIDKDQDDL